MLKTKNITNLRTVNKISFDKLPVIGIRFNNVRINIIYKKGNISDFFLLFSDNLLVLDY